ncbi:hypothetical protein DFJ74DRAFT_532812 [Hyaloraphidium curvatum]|nr:hypothetical protein DFJ74DRAFT_532812 [Hyaloraphidium curvatum]
MPSRCWRGRMRWWRGANGCQEGGGGGLMVSVRCMSLECLPYSMRACHDWQTGRGSHRQRGARDSAMHPVVRSLPATRSFATPATIRTTPGSGVPKKRRCFTSGRHCSCGTSRQCPDAGMGWFATKVGRRRASRRLASAPPPPAPRPSTPKPRGHRRKVGDEATTLFPDGFRRSSGRKRPISRLLFSARSGRIGLGPRFGRPESGRRLPIIAPPNKRNRNPSKRCVPPPPPPCSGSAPPSSARTRIASSTTPTPLPTPPSPASPTAPTTRFTGATRTSTASPAQASATSTTRATSASSSATTLSSTPRGLRLTRARARAPLVPAAGRRSPPCSPPRSPPAPRERRCAWHRTRHSYLGTTATQ